MQTFGSDPDLTVFARRAAAAIHLQFDSVGASTRESFDAAVGAWLSVRQSDSTMEAREGVTALLIEMHAASLAMRQ